MKKLLRVPLSGVRALAGQLAPQLKGGEILGLIGPMGAGKTTFAKELGRLLKVRHTMTSPTFTVMHRFPARLANPAAKETKIQLYHLDLYRTKSFQEAQQTGLTEFWGKKGTVTLIEWADKIKRHLPPKTVIIRFRHG